MTTVSKVRIKIDPNWNVKTLKGIQAGSLELVTDIHRRSNILAPVDTGAMINSSVIKMLSALAFQIIYGSARVPYARRQFFENKTKSRYLEKAADSVMRGNIAKYYRNKV